MRYCIEYHPNPDCMTIHLDRLLTKKMIETYDSPEPYESEDVRPSFVTDIFQINGVERVWMNSYSIGITKGSVFEWDEIRTRALSAIQSNFDPTDPMVEARPAKSPTETELRQIEASRGMFLFDSDLMQ